MSAAETLAIIAAGLFFLNGLLTGVWKYLQIRASPDASAHPYVDIAHRASLMYSFAAILLAKFVEISRLPDCIELISVALPLAFFAAAIGSYMLHGFLQDTDNQLKAPFALGPVSLPRQAMSAFMWALIVAEIGGFIVLFCGVITASLTL